MRSKTMTHFPAGVLGALALTAAAALLSARPAYALSLAIGSGQLVHTQGEASTVFVADPKIADIQVPSPGAILVLGKSAGTTTLYALDATGKQVLSETVVVRHNVAELQNVLRQRFPALRLALESAPGSLMISGAVPDAATTEAIAHTIQPYLGEKEQLINRLSVSSPTQVYLRVRVTEMSKAVTQKLGINWQVLSSPGQFVAGLVGGRDFINDAGNYLLPTEGYSFLGGYSKTGAPAQAMIDLLDKEGLITVLAEPNLTAVSGQTASFLAGGEFPVPIKQDNDAITVEFKPFGVALDFTPTVLGDDRISLKVRPEISELDPNASIMMDSLVIPGIRVRRVETTVEMASGQSFAIGGLLQNNISDVVSKIPGLGSIPVLGKLFSSSDYQNNKSELVVIVTPYLVRPTSPDQLTTPLASLRANSDIEYVLQHSIQYDPLTGNVPRLSGSAGFVY
jgi:pilus assembly protein CpaC